MNSKQIIQIAAKIAPPMLIGVAIFSTLKWLLTDESKEPERAAAKTATGRKPLPFPPYSTVNFQENRKFPANSGGKYTAPPSPAPIPANSAPTTLKISIPTPLSTIPALKSPAQAPFSAAKRKLIMREDMAKIFRYGARNLTRKEAVVALIGLGFGKTAAYEALAINGRFASWLKIAPDGIIDWKAD